MPGHPAVAGDVVANRAFDRLWQLAISGRLLTLAVGRPGRRLPLPRLFAQQRLDGLADGDHLRWREVVAVDVLGELPAHDVRRLACPRAITSTSRDRLRASRYCTVHRREMSQS